MNIFSSIGKHSLDVWSGMCDSAAILGETAVELVALPFHPRRFRFRDAMLAFQRASFDAVPVSAGVGFLLGLILAFQSAAALQTFGVETYVANLLSLALFRELGPIVTAILLAGRTGSAFAAEIGTMKVNEEIDALTTMGLPPVRFLVVPRIVAAVLAMPALTIFVELAGLGGGALVLQIMGIPGAVYWNGVSSAVTTFTIVFGLGKSALFGLIVALTGCSAGMTAKMAADGVGSAATSAVVRSIVSIAVADGIIAVICWFWGI